MTRKLDLAILGACAFLSACVSAPPPPPQAEYQPPASPPAPKVHHARRKTPGPATAGAAGACPWPAHAKPSGAHLETASTEVPMPADASPDSVEGCAVLRFGLSKAGTVSYIDVVSAKPATVEPVALKSLLAAKFRPMPHPAEEALVRVELRATQPDVVLATLKLR